MASMVNVRNKFDAHASRHCAILLDEGIQEGQKDTGAEERKNEKIGGAPGRLAFAARALVLLHPSLCHSISISPLHLLSYFPPDLCILAQYNKGLPWTPHASLPCWSCLPRSNVGLFHSSPGAISPNVSGLARAGTKPSWTTSGIQSN